MKRRLIFRADGNSQIGVGHVIRSLALAEIIAPHFELLFAIKEPSARLGTQIREHCSNILTPPHRAFRDESWLLPHLRPEDLVVLDGYHFSEKDQLMIREKVTALIMVDDLPDRHIHADVLISHGAGIKKGYFSVEPYTQEYLGLDFALLRKAFREAPGPLQQQPPANPEAFFICFGGADPLNLSQKVMEACLAIPSLREIHLVIGPANLRLPDYQKSLANNPNKKVHLHQNLSAAAMCRLMQQCGRGFTSASGVSIEACAAGMQLFTGYYAENQRAHAQALYEQGLALFGGDLRDLTSVEIRDLILEDFHNFALLQRQQDRFGGQQHRNLLQIFSPWISN